MKKAETIVYTDKSRVSAGAERSLCELIRRLDKNKYRTAVAVDYPMNHHNEYKLCGAEVRDRTAGLQWWMGTDRWRRPPRGSDALKRLVFGLKLRGILRKLGASILHVNLLGRDSWVDLAAARTMGIRTVGHVRSLQSQRPLDRRCLGLCDSVICISRYVEHEVSALADKKKIIQIYDPVTFPGPVAEHERDESKLRLGLNKDAVVLSSAAMLDPRKGHDVAIEAFAGLAGDFPKAVLLIAGGAYSGTGDAEKRRLVKIAADLGVEARVIFKGYVSEMRTVYAASDVVLALSKDGEALGRVTLEAAAHGRVAVATAVGATPELISEGLTGFCVPSGNPAETAAVCRRVLADKALALRIGSAAIEHVQKNFDPDSVVRQVESVYEGMSHPNMKDFHGARA